MVFDYDNSQIIKICIIGESQEIIQNFFQDDAKNDQYIKQKRTQNIDAKGFILGKSQIIK